MHILSGLTKDSKLMGKLRRKDATIAIMGLNYESLALAVEWSQHFSVVLYDECEEYIQLLQCGIDPFGDWDEMSLNGKLRFTSSVKEIPFADAFVVAPEAATSNDEEAKLAWVKRTCRHLAGLIGYNSCVIFENNIKLKWIEAICLPILEKCSKLEIGKDFNIGFMPSLEARLQTESINSDLLLESHTNICDAIQRLYSYLPLKGEIESRKALKSFLTKEWSAFSQKMRSDMPGAVMEFERHLVTGRALVAV